MQASLSLISSRLESQNMPRESFNAAYGPPLVRSTSVPSHFPNSMQATQSSSVMNDRYSPIPPGRERSLSQQRGVSDNYSDFRMTFSALDNYYLHKLNEKDRPFLWTEN